MKSAIKKLLKAVYKFCISQTTGRFDKYLISPDIAMAQIASHSQALGYLAKQFNKPGMKILEIGSREVTGPSKARTMFSQAKYTGFDYYPGPNVDIVGDVHKLTSYFTQGKQFDLIYSSACFEHFAMPWIASQEIVKLLKVGGQVFVETHFSYVSHERPWHFFQFSDMALKVLFPEEAGIRCVEAGMSNPMIGRFSALADESLRYTRVGDLFCHSGFLGEKVREVPNFSYQQVKLENLVHGTEYPKPVDMA
ncbi:MAG: methyltransferase domain-containing protein [Turneriella sp.]